MLRIERGDSVNEKQKQLVSDLRYRAQNFRNVYGYETPVVITLESAALEIERLAEMESTNEKQKLQNP